MSNEQAPIEAAVSELPIAPRASSSPIWQILLGLALLACFAWSIHRARTQPISADEACTFLWFLDWPLYKVFDFNDVNNHFLFTLLARICVHGLGTSELTMRLPTLFAAAIYFLSVHRISRYVLGGGPTGLLVGLLVTVNPVVQDYLVAARGYGLALALLAAAVAVCCRWFTIGAYALDSRGRAHAAVAAALLAGSLAACLSFLVPDVAVAVAFVATVWWRADASVDRKMRALFLLRWFVAPGVIALIFIAWPVLIQLHGSLFRYHWFSSFTESYTDLMQASFFSTSLGVPGETVPAAAQATAWKEHTAHWLGIVVPAAIGVLVMGRLLYTLRVRQNRALIFILACAFLSMPGAVLLRALVHLSYPPTRAMIANVFLLIVATAAAVQGEVRWQVARIARWLLAGVGVAVLVVWACQLEDRFFRYSIYDANSRALFDAIVRDAKPGATIHVGGKWLYEVSQNFYRRAHRVDAMMPYEREDHPDPSHFDYFICEPGPEWSGDHLETYRVLYRDPISGTVALAIDHPATFPSATAP